jgi:hypothetical protein
MVAMTEEIESQKALSSTKFERKLPLAVEGLNPYFQKLLLGIPQRNAAYIIDFVINELKRENNGSVNYVQMNIYAIVDLVKHYKIPDLRKVTKEDVVSYLDSLKRLNAILHKLIRLAEMFNIAIVMLCLSQIDSTKIFLFMLVRYLGPFLVLFATLVPRKLPGATKSGVIALEAILRPLILI